MDGEDEQIYPEMPPKKPHFLPVKSQGAVVDGADIEAQQWRCEEEPSQRHVGRILIFRLFLHPFHITDFFAFYCVLPATRTTAVAARTSAHTAIDGV